MIKTIIEQEQRRLQEKGFGCEVQTLSVPVSSSHMQLYLGNDVYVLTGIRLSDEDDKMDKNTVVLSSPTEQMTLTQQSMSMLGTSIVKVFRNRINIVSFGSINDIVKYTKDATETAAIKTLLSNYKNGQYINMYVIAKVAMRVIRKHVICSKIGGIFELTPEHYAIFAANSEYADYAAAAESANITALSNNSFANAKLSMLNFGYTRKNVVQQLSISDMADGDKNTLFTYMQYATGQIIERSVAPYQLEFVRLVPIAKQ